MLKVKTKLYIYVFLCVFLISSVLKKYFKKRSLLNIVRTPELFLARLGASVGFGVMLGTLFLFTDQNTEVIICKIIFIYCFDVYMFSFLKNVVT